MFVFLLIYLYFHAVKRKVKSKRGYSRSVDTFSLSDLSPTTENVPMSDEFKVECVRAKAELRRQKRCIDTVPENSGGTSSQQQAAPSAYRAYLAHTSNEEFNSSMYSSAASVHKSQISTYTHDSDEHVHESNTSSGHSYDSTALSYTSVDTACLPASSFSRTSVTTKVHSDSQARVSHSNFSQTANVNLCDLSSVVVTEAHPTTFVVTSDRGIREMPIMSISESESDLRDSPASDDVKSRVAAMRSLYEAKQQGRAIAEMPSTIQRDLESSKGVMGMSLKSEAPVRPRPRGFTSMDLSTHDSGFGFTQEKK